MRTHQVSVVTCWLLLTAPCNLRALCGVPQPRLVCAEAGHSQAVVIAQLLSRRTIPDRGGADLNIYQLVSLDVLRGEISKRFEVREYNDSGRADFAWKVGRKYLLFTRRAAQSKGWIVESCGNSGALSKAGEVLRSVRAMSEDKLLPVISGMVSTDSWTTGLAAAEVLISGAAGEFRTTTDEDGRFQLRVPSGSYSVESHLNGWTFQPAILSLEDPRNVTLKEGTCAQVQLEGERTP